LPGGPRDRPPPLAMGLYNLHPTRPTSFLDLAICHSVHQSNKCTKFYFDYTEIYQLYHRCAIKILIRIISHMFKMSFHKFQIYIFIYVYSILFIRNIIVSHQWRSHHHYHPPKQPLPTIKHAVASHISQQASYTV